MAVSLTNGGTDIYLDKRRGQNAPFFLKTLCVFALSRVVGLAETIEMLIQPVRFCSF